MLAQKLAVNAPLLDEDDFYYVQHKQIFNLIADAVAEGRFLTPVSLNESVQHLSFGGITPGQYLMRCVTNACASSTQMLLPYIFELKQLSARRKIISISEMMGDFGRNSTMAVSDYLGEVSTEIHKTISGLRTQQQSTQHFSAPMKARIEQLRTGEVHDFIHTGLESLNRIMGGWHRGELAIIAARPSMGKTAMALSTLRQAAKFGTSSIFFSMEITADQASCRLLSDAVWNTQTPISYQNIDQHRVPQHDITRLDHAAEEIERLPLLVDDQRGLTVAEIGARARRIKDDLAHKGQRLDVICIDHLGKIKAGSRYAGNKVHETGEKTNALAQMALDLDVAVIVLQQLNRGPEGREDKRPGLADLRDSGNIEEDADTVSFLYRPAYYLERSKYDDMDKEERRLSLLDQKANTLELIVAKNRRGAICNKEFFIDVRSNAVRGLVV